MPRHARRSERYHASERGVPRAPRHGAERPRTYGLMRVRTRTMLLRAATAASRSARHVLRY